MYVIKYPWEKISLNLPFQCFFVLGTHRYRTGSHRQFTARKQTAIQKHLWGRTNQKEEIKRRQAKLFSLLNLFLSGPKVEFFFFAKAKNLCGDSAWLDEWVRIKNGKLLLKSNFQHCHPVAVKLVSQNLIHDHCIALAPKIWLIC